MTDTTRGRDEAASELGLSLSVATAEAELALPEPDPTQDLVERASEQTDRLIGFDPDDPSSLEGLRTAVDEMGSDLQRRSASRSRMLQAPIRDLSRSADDGGPVATSLVDLRVEVEKLDPASLDLEPGGLTRLLGAIPGIGTPLKRYFMRYESSQTVIDSIIKSLESGRDQLKRDNVTLGEDQKQMRELTLALTEQIALAQALDEQITHRLDHVIDLDDPRRRFIEEELLFSLRQRTVDLQQQLAVNQQGILAVEVIIRNNRELIRGVNRAVDVTVSALQVAVTVALGVAHQKIVLDKVEAINQTTSDLIAGTAQRLKEQGTEIHRQASSAMLDMDALRSAFTDIEIALDEISRYRKEALPQMANTILELDELTERAERSVERLEKGRSATDAIEAATDRDDA